MRGVNFEVLGRGLGYFCALHNLWSSKACMCIYIYISKACIYIYMLILRVESRKDLSYHRLPRHAVQSQFACQGP